MRVKRRFILRFPKSIAKEPWNYHLITRFDIVPNIVAGTMADESATLGYEIEGRRDDIANAITYLRDNGVDVIAGDDGPTGAGAPLKPRNPTDSGRALADTESLDSDV